MKIPKTLSTLFALSLLFGFGITLQAQAANTNRTIQDRGDATNFPKGSYTHLDQEKPYTIQDRGEADPAPKKTSKVDQEPNYTIPDRGEF